MTQAEVDLIKQVAPYQLLLDYVRNDYIYLINQDGSDGTFKGLWDDLVQSIEAPYAVCPIHTEQAWLLYEALHPTTPTDPTAPTAPTTPSIP